MERLQAVLDRSIADASPFTRSLFEATRWSADQVIAFVNRTRNVSVASITATGDPHAAVVIGACLDEQIYFTVAPRSLLGRNLGQHPRIAFTVCEGAHGVMGRGKAVRVARSLEDPDLIERLAMATDGGTFTPPGWDGLVYLIELDTIFAS